MVTPRPFFADLYELSIVVAPVAHAGLASAMSASRETLYIDPATATGQHRPPDGEFSGVPFIVGGDHATKTIHACDRHRRKCAGGRLGLRAGGAGGDAHAPRMRHGASRAEGCRRAYGPRPALFRHL